MNQSTLIVVLCILTSPLLLMVSSTPCQVMCRPGDKVCECSKQCSECELSLEIDSIRSFTSYQTFSTDGIVTRSKRGTVFYINDTTGNEEPIGDMVPCANYKNQADCTEPQWVDGATYRQILAVNGQVPGPTIIVNEDAIVTVHVKNNLTSETTSIHWHGLRQFNTPWMDGVSGVSQCGIQPLASFTYIFKAFPSGTFWYHSHTAGQPSDGVYGGLVIREKESRINLANARFSNEFGITSYTDMPNMHTIVASDWQRESAINVYSEANSGVSFYLGTKIGQIPGPGFTPYETTRGVAGDAIGRIPFYSALINGLGRQKDVPYIQSRLSVFTVTQGVIYRFRLIGAQTQFPFRFSIDSHKLTVIATDGYLIEPIANVDYILFHTGERFDFFVHANQAIGDYIIRIETLEVTTNKGSPPFSFVGNQAEAILHYAQPNDVTSDRYESIANNANIRNCSKTQNCKAVNCPFYGYHQSYGISCVNVNEFKLLENTPNEELPEANATPGCPECMFFLYFDFGEDTVSSTIDGRDFQLPLYPPQTQYDDFLRTTNICNFDRPCVANSPECTCTHVRSIPYNKTIQIVIAVHGTDDSNHPIHLHGHTFHVVKIGYPNYDSTTGIANATNLDLGCADTGCDGGCDPEKCAQPRWDNVPELSISAQTPRKDTIMVPNGGYVVINFISHNPGNWFMHCHIEVHQLQGMALVINEAQANQNPAPTNAQTCGNFFYTNEQFKAKLLFDPANPIVEPTTMNTSCENSTSTIMSSPALHIPILAIVLFLFMACLG